MKTATRVVFNTVILYVKILITMAISLVTVPLVLHALGKSDYGLYSLVGGIIAMLAFLNNSMSVATQRFMSVAMGEGNVEKINKVYNVNIKLHLLLGVLVVVGLEIIGLFAFDRLNIEPESVGRAKIIYQFLIITTFSNIICVPLNGVINAREDMVVFSVIGVIDSLLSLVIALLLSHFSGDKLIFYGFGMMFIPVISLMLTYLYVHKSYPEYKINLKKYSEKGLFKETFGFAGWNLFSAVAMMCRNQGTAIIINLFLGTIVNAAYGIANHINGALGQFTSTFQKAINPQLMKSEGMKNRDRMHSISFISSKFGVLALCLFAVPLIIEMPEVLELWLRRDIPPFTVRLTQYTLLLSIVYQYSSGLMASIQATGKIRNYTIVMGFIILLNLPISYVLLKLSYPVYYLTAAFVVLEMISLIVRIFMAHSITGMDVKKYINEVVKPTIIIIGMSLIGALLVHYCMPKSLIRLVLVCMVYGIIFVVLLWIKGLNESQKSGVASVIRSWFKRNKTKK